MNLPLLRTGHSLRVFGKNPREAPSARLGHRSLRSLGCASRARSLRRYRALCPRLDACERRNSPLNLLPRARESDFNPDFHRAVEYARGRLGRCFLKLLPRQPPNTQLQSICLLGDSPLYHTVKVYGQPPRFQSQSFSRAVLRKLWFDSASLRSPQTLTSCDCNNLRAKQATNYKFRLQKMACSKGDDNIYEKTTNFQRIYR